MRNTNAKTRGNGKPLYFGLGHHEVKDTGTSINQALKLIFKPAQIME